MQLQVSVFCAQALVPELTQVNCANNLIRVSPQLWKQPLSACSREHNNHHHHDLAAHTSRPGYTHHHLYTITHAQELNKQSHRPAPPRPIPSNPPLSRLHHHLRPHPLHPPPIPPLANNKHRRPNHHLRPHPSRHHLHPPRHHNLLRNPLLPPPHLCQILELRPPHPRPLLP